MTTEYCVMNLIAYYRRIQPTQQRALRYFEDLVA
jgi:hypothetical protein